MIGSVQKRFVHFFFHTTGTEGKEQFVAMTVRQHGMVQFTGRQDFALNETKVLVDVRVTRLRIDGRMSFGVGGGLVHPRVQGGDIDVVNFLAGGDMMVEFDGIGTTSTESLSRFKRIDKVEFPDEGVDLWVGVSEVVPFTSPDLNDVVPLVGKLLDFVLGDVIEVLHRQIIVAGMFFVAMGITGRASVGETALKFVDGVGVGAITIHMQVGPGDLILALISDMLDVLRVWIGTGQEIVGGKILEGALT